MESYLSATEPIALAQDLVRMTMAIYGLTWDGGGSLAVERALQKIPGVTRASVNAATEMAYVQFHSGVVTPDQLVRAVRQVGLGAGEAQFR